MACLRRRMNQLKTLINETTRSETLLSIPGDENQPELQVRPEMLQVNYYETMVEESEYIPKKSFNERKQTHIYIQKYIETNGIFECGGNEGIRSVALIGSAGYGKTVLLKRLTTDILGGSIPSLNDVEVVHYMSLKHFGSMKENVSLARFLFRDFLSVKESRRVIRWIKRNPKRFLLIIDDIDQCPGELGKYCKDKKSFNFTDIVNGIISGNSMKGVRVLYSCKEHTIKEFEEEMRPDRVVSLAGFSIKSIEKLIHGIVGPYAEELWNHLQTKAQSLLSYCSIPIFMHFTIQAFLKQRDNPPQTVTEVIMIVLYDMITFNQNDRLEEITTLLTKMAFEAMKDGKVTFTENDLPPGLNIATVYELNILCPSFDDGGKNLKGGTCRFSFCHQSVQEALSSLYISQLPIIDFKHSINRLHTSHWAIVRRLVCGMLLNEATHKIRSGHDAPIFKILDVFEKGEIFRQSLAEEFQKAHGKEDELLELLHAANECGEIANDLIAATVMDLTLENIVLTRADCYLLACISSRCSEFKHLALRDVDTLQVPVLGECLVNSKLEVTIEEIGIGKRNQMHLCQLLFPHSMDPDDASIEMIISAVKKINLGEVGLDLSNITYLATLVNRCKRLVQLTIRSVTTMHLRKLAKPVESRNVKLQIMNPAVLDLRNGEERFKLLCAVNKCGDAVDDFIKSHMTRIDIVDIPPERCDVQVIASIISRCARLEWIRLPPCFRTSDLWLLAETAKASNLQVSKMYFSFWGSYPDLTDLDSYLLEVFKVPTLTDDGANAVCALLPYVTKEIALQYKVEGRHIAMIKLKLDSLPPKDLKVWILSPMEVGKTEVTRFKQHEDIYPQIW